MGAATPRAGLDTLAQHYGKKRYRTADFAEKVARDCEEKRGVALRAYYCGICQGYHLTKKSLEESSRQAAESK